MLKMSYCVAVLLAIVSIATLRLATAATCPLTSGKVKCASRGLTSMADLTGPRSKVTSLYLQKNRIVLKSSKDFEGFSGMLNFVNLDDNNITTLPAGVFDKIPGLKGLWLNNNQIRTLPAGLFDKPARLEYLFLGHNRITDLPIGLFANLRSLQGLLLSFNNISVLTFEHLTGLSNLVELNFAGNNIEVLPSDIFYNHLGLKTLNLNDNQITILPIGVFDKFSHLTNLEFSDNRVETIPEEYFDKLRGLTVLCFSSNRITALPHGIFDNLNKLMWLRIFHNPITTLPVGIFDKLARLVRLEVYGCPFQNMDCERFCPVLYDPIGRDKYCFGETYKEFCHLGYCTLNKNITGRRGAGIGKNSLYRAEEGICPKGYKAPYRYCPGNGKTFPSVPARNLACVADSLHATSSANNINVNHQLAFCCLAVHFFAVLFLNQY